MIKLWERELEMVTQDVKLSNALKVNKFNQFWFEFCEVCLSKSSKVVNERRVVTLENILLKANLKLGGLNYEMDLEGILPRDDTR